MENLRESQRKRPKFVDIILHLTSAINLRNTFAHVKPEFEAINEAGFLKGFLGGSEVKNPAANTEDTRDAGWIAGSGRFPEVGNANLLQYSGLEKFHGQRNYSPWDGKESNTTEHTHTGSLKH